MGCYQEVLFDDGDFVPEVGIPRFDGPYAGLGHIRRAIARTEEESRDMYAVWGDADMVEAYLHKDGAREVRRTRADTARRLSYLRALEFSVRIRGAKVRHG